MAGKEVKVGDMEVTLIDGVPLGSIETGDISQVYTCCEICVDGEEVVDDDYNSPLDEYMPDHALIPVEYIFAFDTKLFKSFERSMDASD